MNFDNKFDSFVKTSECYFIENPSNAIYIQKIEVKYNCKMAHVILRSYEANNIVKFRSGGDNSGNY